MSMRNYLLPFCLAACGMATVCAADDLAWKFDTSGRTADVVMASDSVTNPDRTDVRGPSGGVSQPIPLFDSRWTYTAEFGYFEYRFRPGIFFIVR